MEIMGGGKDIWLVVWLKSECNFCGADTQTLLSIWKNTFLHSQMVGTQNIRVLDTSPSTSTRYEQPGKTFTT